MIHAHCTLYIVLFGGNESWKQTKRGTKVKLPMSAVGAEAFRAMDEVKGKVRMDWSICRSAAEEGVVYTKYSQSYSRIIPTTGTNCYCT